MDSLDQPPLVIVSFSDVRMERRDAQGMCALKRGGGSAALMDDAPAQVVRATEPIGAERTVVGNAGSLSKPGDDGRRERDYLSSCHFV